MLYLITDGELIKIGVSKNPLKRLAQLQTGHPKKLKLVKVFDVPDYWERRLHRQLWMFRERPNGEWFRLDVSKCVEFLEETLNK